MAFPVCSSIQYLAMTPGYTPESHFALVDWILLGLLYDLCVHVDFVCAHEHE